MMTRRTLLQTITGAAVGSIGTSVVAGSPLLQRIVAARNGGVPIGNPLRIPDSFTGIELVASIHTQQIFPGIDTTVWTLGGSYPGPTIRVRRGDRFAVRLRNELDEETIVHWHGQLVPAGMDGHPMEAIGPGESFDYEFDVLNRAGTYFYHPHPHEHTGRQAYMGMGGFFIVTDEVEESLGLPDVSFDIPLMIQDRLFTPDRQITYELSGTQRLNGLLGDTILVNGTPEPYLEVSADLYRFRLLNASNARILRIGFQTGEIYTVIGTDGGLLDQPYEADALYLAPAERLDILVDFSQVPIGSSLQLMTLGFGGATNFRTHGTEMPLLRFDVTSPSVSSGTIPATLATIDSLNPNNAARTRIWELQTRPVPLNGHSHRINGRTFDMERIDAQVRSDEVEIWEIRNTHTMPHPIHIHGVQFQVLERIDGEPILPRDYGWKDVILIWGEETVRVIMRFAPYDGVFLIHCHNLEHEDEGMMLNYEIGEVVSDVEDAKSNVTKLDLL